MASGKDVAPGMGQEPAATRPLPPVRRVTLLSLLVLATCVGLLLTRGVIETRAQATRAQSEAGLAAADAARLLAPGAPHAVPLPAAAGDVLALAARGGRAELREAERVVLGVGSAGGPVAVATRPLPGGQSVVVARPTREGAVPPILPYALAALALTLLTGSMLLALRRYADGLARERRERGLMLSRLLGPELAGCGVWRAEADRLVIPAALSAALGYGRAERTLTQKEATALIDPRDTARALAFLRGPGLDEELRVRVRRADEESQHVYMRVLTTDERGAGGIVLPVSERGLDDGRSRQMSQRLRETLAAIPQAFLLWDAYGRLVAWNDEFRVIFDVASADIREGMDARELAGICGIAPRYLMDYFAPPEGPSQRGEAAFPDDRVLKITRRRTIGDGWVCIGTDVTDTKEETRAREAKEAELQMTVDILERSRAELTVAVQGYQREKARAEAANRSKSEFLANMSHELRTPLNAINGFSALMQAELYGPLGHEKYHEYVADILESGEHLLALIDDVLDLSKIEAGRLQLSYAQTNLERLLAEALRLVEPQAREADIRLKAVVDHVPTVWGDPRAVKQVVVNLLSNAEKFTPQGGTITLTAQADLDTVTILVADTGLGITPEQLSRLGQPFELIDDNFAGRRRGTGLGLSLCKSLVEMQSGVLAIASEPGRGTVAAVTLPRRPGATVRLPAMLQGRAQVLTRAPEAAPSEAAVVPFPRRAAG